MKNLEAKTKTARRSENRERGFTMLEMAVVTVIIMIVSAMAIIQLQPTWQQSQANAAMDQVKSGLRQARELAISQRRTIVVQFSGNNTISLFQLQVQIPAGGGPPIQVLATTPLATWPLQNKMQFTTFAAEPDTPDVFGIPGGGAGLEFGGNAGVPPSGLAFQSDGTFTDGNGIPINGTVFLGITGMPTTARAITVLGATGRVRAWHGTGVRWFL